MKIGKIQLKNNLIFAPLAGFSIAPVRRFMAQNGAPLTVTEMVSVKGLLYNSQKTNDLLCTDKSEKIKCVQLFGNQPDEFYRCALLPAIKDFDIIDINMGCPVKKIVKNGEGSALIANPQAAAAIVLGLKSLGKTVSVKTRLGVNDPTEIFEFAPHLFDAGVDMLAVHGRTTAQMYSGTADLDPIFKLKKMYPHRTIVANGDIVDTDGCKRALDGGVDGIMIGRGAFINPQIFYLAQNKKCPSRKQMVLSMIDYVYDDLKERTVPELRKFLPYLLKNVRGGKELRIKMNFSESVNQLIEGINCLQF